MSDIKKTPLYEEHVKLGGKIVEFAGWYLPVQYRGLREEHVNVRENVGLFDVSHMGEIRLKGKRALETAEWLTSNHVGRLESGEAQYSLLTNEGGIVDDLIVYCLKKNEDYLFCVNASNTAKDWDWIQRHNKGADITNESSVWAQIAVQGPKAIQLVSKVFGAPINELKFFGVGQYKYQSHSCIIARTGYTGEDGVEVFVPAAGARQLWQALLAEGQPLGVQPVGLGARDTLRTEMDFSLYGHEIDDATNPYTAGLGWVVKPKAKDFVGKEIILANKENGTLKRINFVVSEKGIPRPEYSLYSVDNKAIGKVTSGTLSPSLNEPIGIGYVEKEYAEIGSEVLVEIRQRKVKAKIIKPPFVKKESNK